MVRKKIYEGPSEQVYSNVSFQDFMRRFCGAEKATYNPEFKNGLCEFYHIEPQGVTLRFIIEGNPRTAELTLFGDEKAIAYVEKRIFDGIKKLEHVREQIEKLQVYQSKICL